MAEYSINICMVMPIKKETHSLLYSYIYFSSIRYTHTRTLKYLIDVCHPPGIFCSVALKTHVVHGNCGISQ